MEFNPAPPTVMHVDINSCFATIEQQANPALRGRPTVVAAYAENHGCILAASREAKKLGIATGMRVREGREICRNLIVLPPDPNKYRFVNHQMRAVLGSYTPALSVESIDEMVMNMAGTARLAQEEGGKTTEERMTLIAGEIKRRIRAEIGEWITVSIGIAPNRYLSKVASGLHKPDGLDVISRETIESILSGMQLEDLTGIKTGYANRFRYAGIPTPIALYRQEPERLEHALHSIVGYYWWRRLHGYEDGSMYKDLTADGGGAGETMQKSFGQSHALSKPKVPTDPELWQILSQLVVKMARRLRTDGFTARGVGVSALLAPEQLPFAPLSSGFNRMGAAYDHTTYWHTQEMHSAPLFADTDFYRPLHRLLVTAPPKPVRILAVYCYRLRHDLYAQQSLLEEETRKERLTRALDAVAQRWGDFTVTPGRMLAMRQKVLDRIAFGRVRELNK